MTSAGTHTLAPLAPCSAMPSTRTPNPRNFLGHTTLALSSRTSPMGYTTITHAFTTTGPTPATSTTDPHPRIPDDTQLTTASTHVPCIPSTQSYLPLCPSIPSTAGSCSNLLLASCALALPRISRLCHHRHQHLHLALSTQNNLSLSPRGSGNGCDQCRIGKMHMQETLCIALAYGTQSAPVSSPSLTDLVICLEALSWG
ncbi:hypothetical protein B0O80DRAFT_474566 [Mortierella sp. GBAus27b]|nr:hypothetical protein B0O80DRAFT_474566 [Mortierella sp. GBAus27b]